ncbi:MAG: hypothetical protein ACYDD1_02860 [Caulobacteraceae bacterium]
MSKILIWLDGLLKRWLIKRGQRPPLLSPSSRPVRLAASAGCVFGAFIMLAHGHGFGEEDPLVHLQMYGFYCVPPAVILGSAAAILRCIDKDKPVK